MIKLAIKSCFSADKHGSDRFDLIPGALHLCNKQSCKHTHNCYQI